MPPTDEFLEALRYVRANLSSDAFKREVGVSRQAVNYWLNGVKTPSAEAIKCVMRLSRGLKKVLSE